MGGMQDEGFAALPLTQRPGQREWTENDLSGRYWIRGDDRYVEEPREDLVPEIDFGEFNPDFAGTYFEHVHAELARRFPIGRVRVLSKALFITAIPGTAIRNQGCIFPLSPIQDRCLSSTTM